ncbi:hydrogenase maturation protease [Spongiactinospora sp. TRM90649]|uniref:hydrogenase maturation protease n=1 Tax=Spongiactinospora sp. TRM90649 TaxID=3031114 RepID=UPI0023F79A33|nr:hydrogenase maturation protease [Spongiactinospora sp. TRM90649]MDF5755229.1 hydrogenase maturation protease [Spongiactinospora sp. TRM90649]
MTSHVLIGVGNEYRGDDGAGLAVARLLGGVQNGGDPAELIEVWTGIELAIVVDAARSGAAPGTVLRHTGLEGLPATTASTHSLSLRDAADLGRALGRLPGRLVLYTIEGADFGFGSTLSPAVATAVVTLATALHPWTSGRTSQPPAIGDDPATHTEVSTS